MQPLKKLYTKSALIEIILYRFRTCLWLLGVWAPQRIHIIEWLWAQPSHWSNWLTLLAIWFSDHNKIILFSTSCKQGKLIFLLKIKFYNQIRIIQLFELGNLKIGGEKMKYACEISTLQYFFLWWAQVPYTEWVYCDNSHNPKRK